MYVYERESYRYIMLFYFIRQLKAQARATCAYIPSLQGLATSTCTMGEKADDTADTSVKAKNKAGDKANNTEKTTASKIAYLLRPFAKKHKGFVKYAENKNIKKAKLDVDKIKDATPILAKLKTIPDQTFKQSDLEWAMAKLVKDSYTYPYILYIYRERFRYIYIYTYIYVYVNV